MPKISAEAAERRRSHILEAARQCFAEHGIHVSVDEICARAGVSKGAFYLYFASKDAAIEALAQGHERVVASLAEPDTVEGLTEKLVQLTIGSGATYSRLELETWSHALRMPALRAALRDNSSSLRRALTRSISRMFPRAAQDQAPSPASAAEILTIFCMGLLATCALGTEESATSAEAALRALVPVLIQGKPSRGRSSRTGRRA